MVERQRLSSNLFANMGAASSETGATQSPIDMHSDLLSADDLPNEAVITTPSKTLSTMDPMDVFPGSSPTPHARKSAKHVASGSTGITTPIAIRTIQLDNAADLGSSPPQFMKIPKSVVGTTSENVPLGSSFKYQASEEQYSLSFDEGTTIDDAAMLAADTIESGGGNIFMDTVQEQLSPNIDLQLTAQIDADMQACIATSTQPLEEDVLESNNDFVDAISHHPLLSALDQEPAYNDKEVADSQILSCADAGSSDLEPDFDTSSISCVGDSFIKPDTNKENPKTQTLRRSSRRSSASSPTLSTGGKDRKQSSAKHSHPTRDDEESSIAHSDDEDMLDNITVAFPKTRSTGKKRKSKTKSQIPSDEPVLVPETSRKRDARRSQSLLNQVENSQDIVVEDTPAPKRARGSVSQDVSTAKHNSQLEASQTKRLSHVQVTPKRSPEIGSARELMTAPENEDFVSGGTDRSVVSTPKPKASRQRFEESMESQQASVGVSTPARSFTERVILTPRSIINQLKNLKDYLFSAPPLVLRREEEREFDDVLFGIRMQVHAAGRRGEEPIGGQE